MVVYLAGPINECSLEQMHDWRDKLRAGHPDITFLDPTDRSYKVQQWRRLVEDDIEDIDNSDFVLAYVWKNGAGTSMELAYSHYVSKVPTVVVVDDFEKVSPWVRYHADYLVQDFESAIKIIKADWS